MEEYTQEQLNRLREIEIGLFHTLEEICRRHNLCFVTGFGTTLGAIRHQGYIPWDDDMDFLMPRPDYEEFIRVAPSELPENVELLEPRVTKDYVMSFAKLSRRDSVFIEPEDGHIRYHNGIFIDIFPMDYWPKEKKKWDRLAFGNYILLRLCALATYRVPKLPNRLSPLKKRLALAGCTFIHGFLKIFRITTPKIYRKYLKRTMSTTREEGDGFVTDMTWCWPRKDGMIGLKFEDTGLFTQHYVPFEDTQVPVPRDYDAYLKKVYREYMQLPPPEDRHSHKPAVLVFPEEMETAGEKP